MQLKKYQIVVLSIFFFFACSLAFLVIGTIIVQLAAASPVSPISIRIQEGQLVSTINEDVLDIIFEPRIHEPIPMEQVITVPPELGIEEMPQPEQTPTPVPTFSPEDMAQNQVNILLLGSDQRDDPSFRTDIIILLSIDLEHNTVSAVSFPRDLYVQIPGWQMNRINTAQQVGGFQMMADTFEYNFGIRPEYYFMVDFNGFKAVIDSLGGIDVNAAVNLSDSCSDINDIGWCSVGPGMVYMDSTMALWYVRSRYSTSDFERTRRAQEVVQAIFNKAMSLGALTKIPELYDIYTQYVETNMTIKEILPLIPMANVIQDTSRIRRFTVGPDAAYDWITESGAMVLIPDYNAIYGILAEALYLYE